jgi:DNA polymerase-3 subunit gamma/tau
VEGFVVSARKYRPSTFESVVGQSHVTSTLKNAITLGQLAHAFLFSGPRGVGKTTCARILAKAINCNERGTDGEPCNHCDSCAGFNEGRSLNIHELDAASNNSVEDIRKIIDQVRYVPSGGKKAVFIIDEVHMLSSAAFNAFLKTLEEPPSHAIFILATTEKHKILPTILSRVQKFDFRRIKVDDIAEHLKNISTKEDIKYEFEGLQLIGLKADGALRDALSIFDQIVSFSNRNVTYATVVENLHILDYEYFFKAVDYMIAGDHESMLVMLHEIIELGFDGKDFMVGLVEHFRNLLIAQTPKTLGLLETSDNVRKRYLGQVNAASSSFLLNAFNLAAETEQKLRSAGSPRLAIELGLMKLVYLGQAIDVAALAEKKKLSPEPAARDEKVLNPDRLSISAPLPTQEGEVKPFIPKVEPVKPKTTFTSKFAIPKSLDEIALHDEKSNKTAEEEAEAAIAHDANVRIDETRFYRAFESLVDQLINKNKMSVSTALRKDTVKLIGNRWIQTVQNEVLQRQLDEEREFIVPFMRERVGLPTLILEIEISETLAEARDLRPYTNEAKLEAMLQKNPLLRDFMKKFDTMINY